MSPSSNLSEYAAFAAELAQAARSETLPRWSECCPADDKGGSEFDPVTEADRRAEQVMRSLIRDRYPEHGVTGEEYPDEASAGPYCWSLDPIDGTRSFICQVPTWTTLIALLKDGCPVLGLIDTPCLDETYLGFGRDGSLIWRGEQAVLETKKCQRLADARLSTTDPFILAPGTEAFDALRRSVRVTRYGLDAYAYARLAAGSLDLVVEAGLQPHDYHALIPVVRAAGGVIGDWQGGTDFTAGQIIAAATAELYDAAVESMVRTR